MSTDTTPRPDPGRRHDATAMTATARGKRTPTELDSGDAPELSRGLENRHLQLIAIGGALALFGRLWRVRRRAKSPAAWRKERYA